MSILSLALAAALTSNGVACQNLLKNTSEFTSCIETPHGIAVGNDLKHVAALASYASDSEERFAKFFGRAIPRYVIVSTPPTPSKTLFSAEGYKVILPWQNPATFAAARRAGIEKSLRDFGKAQGMSEDRIQALVAKALDSADNKDGPSKAEASMVPHELGHRWSRVAFWPNMTVSEKPKNDHHSGTPAADWLDELPGVLIENDDVTQTRRDQFTQLLRGETVAGMGPAIDRQQLLNLREIFRRESPALQRARMRTENAVPAGAVRVAINTGESGVASSMAQERLFYMQIRSVADFLLGRSGGPQIFAEILQTAANGLPFENWLQKNGPKYQLPTTVDQLQRDWESAVLSTVRRN